MYMYWQFASDMLNRDKWDIETYKRVIIHWKSHVFNLYFSFINFINASSVNLHDYKLCFSNSFSSYALNKVTVTHKLRTIELVLV